MKEQFKVGDEVIDSEGEVGLVDSIDLDDSTIYVEYTNGWTSMFNLEGSDEDGNIIVHTTNLDKALN